MVFAIKDELQTDLVSNIITTKNSKEGKVMGSILIAILTSSCILLALPKKQPYQNAKIYESRAEDLNILFLKFSI